MRKETPIGCSITNRSAVRKWRKRFSKRFVWPSQCPLERNNTMRYSNVLIGAILAWWPLLAASDPHATAKVTQGKNACYEIHLPGCWHQKANGNYGYCIGYQSGNLLGRQYFYELRMADGRPGTIFIGSHNEQLPDGRAISET